MSANDFDDKVELFDVQTGSLVKSFEHVNVRRAVFSHDGTRVISTLSLCESSSSLHLPASPYDFRLWDLTLEKEDLRNDYVESKIGRAHV